MSLFAYGRSWTTPTAPVRLSGHAGDVGWSRLKVTAPKVRVPTVFTVGNDRLSFGQLVVYPDAAVRWDRKISVFSLSAPEWFRQWAQAVGLPLTAVAADASSNDLRNPGGGGSLLIVGTESELTVSQIARKAKTWNVNTLSLVDPGIEVTPRFINPRGYRNPIRIEASAVAGGLAELAAQRWAKPLIFGGAEKPRFARENRWAWISDPNYPWPWPLVEQVAIAQDHPPVILDHLPWFQQLGRNEVADEVFLRLLIAAAKSSAPQLDRPVKMFWPRTWPRLTEGIRYNKDRTDPVVVIMLNESFYPNEDVWKTRESLQGDQIVILGDHPMLDEWKWLKLDRKKMNAGRDGVYWLPKYRLTNTQDHEWLMLKLTELGVPLVPPSQQEEKKQ